MYYFCINYFFEKLFEYRYKKGKEILNRKKEKFGYFDGYDELSRQQKNNIIWINAVSVGEISSVIGLAKELINSGYFVLFTSTTVLSQKWLEKYIPNGSTYRFTPYPSIIYFRRFLKIWKPKLTIFIESEIWPNLICEIKKFTPFCIINGKLSNKSNRLWKIINKIIPFFKKIDFVVACDELNKYRFQKLGVESVEYFGNLKFDSARDFILRTKILEEKNHKYQNINKVLIKMKKKIIVFANFRDGENFIIPTVLEDNNAFGILIPRQLNMLNNVINEINNIKYVFVNDYNINIEKFQKNLSKSNLLIINDIGDVGCYYDMSDIVIIGGSFVQLIGGHSPIEALALNKPVIIGEFHKNCQSIVSECLLNDAIKISNFYTLSNDIKSIFKKKWNGNFSYINNMLSNDISKKIIQFIEKNIF